MLSYFQQLDTKLLLRCRAIVKGIFVKSEDLRYLFRISKNISFLVAFSTAAQTIGKPEREFKFNISQVPEGSRVRFRLSDGEFPCSYGCQSYVEIKHKLDIRLTGFRR